MNITDVFTILRGRLGGRDDDAKLRTFMIQELNAAQIQLEMGPLWPWFLETSVDIIITSYKMDLPSDFLTEVEDAPFIYTSADGIEYHLEKRYYTELRAKQDVNASAGSAPQYFTLAESGKAYLYPKVSDGTVTFIYNAKQPLVNPDGSITGNNAWYSNAPLLLISKAGYDISTKYYKDMDMAQLFSTDVATFMQQLQTQHVQREMARFDPSQQRLYRAPAET